MFNFLLKLVMCKLCISMFKSHQMKSTTRWHNAAFLTFKFKKIGSLSQHTLGERQHIHWTNHHFLPNCFFFLKSISNSYKIYHAHLHLKKQAEILEQ